MRGLLATEPNRPPVLEDNVTEPKPGAGELLVRVHAAGVIATELGWYPTSHTKTGQVRSGAVLGHELSGVVEAVGEGVGRLEVGREVYGMNDWFCDGAMAEYCVTPFFAVAPKPDRLTHVEAASVPISALTAWQGLFDRANLQPGEVVLVHGGAGSVGVFVVQLAKLHGARVVATASAWNAGLVASLGAERVIDYRGSRFEDEAGLVDVVFDTVGGETLGRSWGVLKPGGRMVTIVSEAESSTDPRIQKAFFIVEPNQKQLYEIAGMLDSGRLRTIVDSVRPLSQAPEAYTGVAPRQHRGKVVIAITNPN